MTQFLTKSDQFDDSELDWQGQGEKKPAPFRPLDAGRKPPSKTKKLSPQESAEKMLKDLRADLERYTQVAKDLDAGHTLTVMLENSIAQDSLMDSNRSQASTTSSTDKTSYKPGNFNSSRYIAAQRVAYSMLIDDVKNQIAAQEKIVRYLSGASISPEEYAKAQRDFREASQSAMFHKKAITNIKPQDFPYATVQR